ncbi:MAG: DUF433 domain-containing protein [Chitinophagales bacterium]|nr:DUF433 domain-containing protein [Chitinophagales bacterium]
MDWRGYIIADNAILMGKPIVKGTRISVELILELLIEGWSEAQILESYPSIQPIHLRAVYAYLKDKQKILPNM